ncbi:MAG: agmatinase [Dehalococcoidia bacterium]
MTLPIRPGWPTFFGAPPAEDPEAVRADVAVLGIPFDAGTNDRPGARFGPLGVREASMRLAPVNGDDGAGWLDAESGQTLLRGVSIVDAGDVDIRTISLEDNFGRITEAAAFLRSRCRLPVFVGGDHAVTFPLVRAFENGPLTVVQFDAHQDYTDDKYGQRFSHDNQMRRISELTFVQRIVQVGLRGALEHAEPYRAAVRDGVQTVTSERIVRDGVELALADVHPEGDTYVTIDIDILDPATAPGTGFPEPGGIGYYQLKDALLLIARRSRVIAFDLCEVNPTYDSAGVTARIASRLMLDLMGAIIPSVE